MTIKSFYELKKDDVVEHRIFGDCKVVEVKRLNNGVMFESITEQGRKKLKESALKGIECTTKLINCFTEMKASFVNKKK